MDKLRDDDLPGQPGDPEHSYISMMVENVRTIADALGGNPRLLDGFDIANLPGLDNAVEQSQ